MSGENPARWTDPETSWAAGDSSHEERAALAQQILMLHRQHPGGLANFQVAELLGLEETTCYWKRIGELRDGIVRKNGTIAHPGGYLEWAPGPDGKPRRAFREQTRKWQRVSRITVKGLTEDWI